MPLPELPLFEPGQSLEPGNEVMMWGPGLSTVGPGRGLRSARAERTTAWAGFRQLAKEADDAKDGAPGSDAGTRPAAGDFCTDRGPGPGAAG